MPRLVRALLLLEGLALALGAAGMAALGVPPVASYHPYRDALAFFLLYFGLLGLEELLQRAFPDTARASEALLRRAAGGIPEGAALALAAASALAEEVFFRGFLYTLFARLAGAPAAVGLSALVFALFHPVPDRRAWGYPVYVFLAGVAFALVFALTGSLLPGVLAHFLYNARGFEEARAGQLPPGSRYLG